MPALQLAVYLYMIMNKENPENEILITDYQTRQVSAEVMEIYCKLTRKTKEEYDSRLNDIQRKNIWWNKGFKNIMPVRSKINDLIYENIDDPRLADEYAVTTKKVYGSSKYEIYASFKRFIII